MDEERWRDDEWLATARAWALDRAAAAGRPVTGEVEQTHVTRWSTVLRLPTDRGPLWFKANDDAMRHEAGLVDLLAARRPDAVPPLLASEPDRGWMLMDDAGERLRAIVPRERSLDRWHEALRLYAEVQVAATPDTDAMLALGVPDRRLGGLPEQYAGLVARLDVEPRFREAVGEVERLCDELAATDLPDTVQHDDLHDGQVFVRDGRTLLLDWGDSCVTHPFLTLSVTLEGVIAWGVDDEEDSEDLAPYVTSYLGPWQERYGAGRDLVAAVHVARRLGWACRAVNGHVPGDDDQTRTRLRMFLDGRP
ncbi:phosphotransferase family protein [Nocardioides taihuensis]|uniref:Phosphotransferase family protein n=1 Tax=Nocardioides taihuensis TaxID=1835606 RepID=A0ABW0BIE2_9ACTN